MKFIIEGTVMEGIKNEWSSIFLEISKALREHRQKTFVTLSGFWPLRGLGGPSESV